MFTVNISFDASTRTLSDASGSDDYTIATMGDNESTRLVFNITDDGNLLDGMAGRVEFDVWIHSTDNTVYKPYILLDDQNSVTIPNYILREVKRSTMAIQLAFGDDQGNELYSFNKLTYNIANAVQSIDSESIAVPEVMLAYTSITYDNTTCTLTFTRLNGSTTEIMLGDLFGPLVADVTVDIDTTNQETPITMTLDRMQEDDTVLHLAIPYLDNGVIPSKFISTAIVVDVYKLTSKSQLTDGTCAGAEPPDFALINGTELYMCIGNDPSDIADWFEVTFDVRSYVQREIPSFVGTFNSVQALSEYTGATNHDFAIVTGTDSQNNYQDFYQATVSGNSTSWTKKFRAYNLSLSSSQWNAVNSGATSQKIQNYDAHLIDTNNPHIVTKSQVGLGDVVNQGMDSTPTDSSQKYVTSGGVYSAIGVVQNDIDIHEADTSNPHSVTKTQVGLGNVDNTSDLDKPVSTAQQTALDGKVDKVTSSNSYTRLYGVNTQGQQGVYNLDVGKNGGTVAWRDAQGHLVAETPSENGHVAIKKYVDDADALKLDDSQLVTSWSDPVSDTNIPSEKLTKDTLDTKLDKVTSASSYSRAYAVNTSGGQIMWNVVQDSAYANSIARRTSEGKLFTATPVAGDDGNIATNKTYVDTGLSGKLDGSQLVTSWQSTVSDSNIPSEKLTKDSIDAVQTNLTNHTSRTDNPHSVTKSQVELGNVQNYGMDSSPTNGSSNYVTSGGTYTAINGVATDLSTHTARTDNPHQVTKSQVGLGNVDNTSDANKPISTATQSALDGKVDKTATASQIYGTTPSVDNVVSQTTYSISTGANNNHIVQRQSNGQITVPQTPVADTDAVSRSFVNSSIGTNTANFLGTWTALEYRLEPAYLTFTSTSDYIDYYVDYNSVKTLVTSSNKDSLGIVVGTTKAYSHPTDSLGFTQTQVDAMTDPYSTESGAIATQLAVKISNPSNNDYCFVEMDFTDPATSPDEYRRYKFDGTSWVYEYTLNNSSFTQAQWDAINSGISATKVATYDAYASNKLDKVTTTTDYDQIYAKSTNGTQAMFNISSGILASTIVRRTSQGQIEGVTPTGDSHVANKKYVDDGLSGKLDKSTTISSVYAVNASNEQAMITYDMSASASSIARRGTNGVLKVGTPSDNADATTKLYVDTALGLKLDDTQLVTSWQSTVLDTNIPSEKLVKDSLDGKLDKIIPSTGGTYVYACNSNDGGTQFSMRTTDSLVNGTIPYRSYSDGTINIGTPTADTHATTKKYVDDGLATKVAPKSGTGVTFTADHIATFDDTTGKVIKDSGYTIATSVPSGAVFTDKYTDQVSTNTNGNFPILLKNTNSYGNETSQTKFSSSTYPIVANPSTGTITATAFAGNLDWSYVQNKPTIDATPTDGSTNAVQSDGVYDALAGKLDDSQLVTSWGTSDANATDSNIASAKLTKDSLDGKQATLVSGTNIKTVKNTSLLGSGDIPINDEDVLSYSAVTLTMPSGVCSNDLYISVSVELGYLYRVIFADFSIGNRSTMFSISSRYGTYSSNQTVSFPVRYTGYNFSGSTESFNVTYIVTKEKITDDTASMIACIGMSSSFNNIGNIYTALGNKLDSSTTFATINGTSVKSNTAFTSVTSFNGQTGEVTYPTMTLTAMNITEVGW